MIIYNFKDIFRILIGLFCIFSFCGCKQDSVIIHTVGFSNEPEEKAEIENLINNALEQVIFNSNKDFKYINLLENTITIRPIEPKDVRYKSDQNLLSKYNFKSDVFLDSTVINLKNYEINKVKLFTKETVPYRMYTSRKDTLISHDISQKLIDSLNRITFSYFYTKIDKDWSRERIKAQIEKARKKYVDEFPFEDHFLHYISKPLFSRDRKYAILTINREIRGSSYIFKKATDKWILVQSFRSWIR